MVGGLPPLIGRGDELRAIPDRLVPGQVVTLLGPGGVGKTTLARALAADRTDTRWVELAALDAGADPAIALGSTFDTPAEHALAALTGWAEAAADPMVVLDNAEHVIEPVRALVGELDLPRLGLTVLVTSRVPLGAANEATIEIEPLPTADAATLYAARAATEVDDDTARLCVALDGLPLAVELAAARSAVLGPRELLDRLDRLPGLLQVADGRARHEGLDPLVRWSVELLEPGPRKLFETLSIFPSSVDLAAVEVFGWAVGVPDPVLALESLVHAALVAVDRQGGRRFRMLATIRAVAAELLDESGARGHAEEAAVTWLLSLTRPDGQDWSEQLRADWHNVRSSFDLAVVRRPDEAGRLLAKMGPSVGHLGGTGLVDRWAEALLARATDPAVVTRMSVLRAQAANRAGRLDDAQQLISAAIASVQHMEHDERIAVEDEVYYEAGSIAYYRDDLPGARAAWERSLELGERAGNDLSVAYTLAELSWIEPDLSRAIHLLEGAVSNLGRYGRHLDQSTTLVNLATRLVDAGRIDEARIRADEAAAAAVAAGSRRAEGGAAHIGGLIAKMQGRLAEAMELATQAVAVYEESGERNRMGRARANLAVYLTLSGRVAEARVAAAQAHAAVVDQPEQWRVPAVHALAFAAAAAGDSQGLRAALEFYPPAKDDYIRLWGARADLDDGEPEAALERVRGLDPSITIEHHTYTSRVEAEALALVGDLAGARHAALRWRAAMADTPLGPVGAVELDGLDVALAPDPPDAEVVESLVARARRSGSVLIRALVAADVATALVHHGDERGRAAAGGLARLRELTGVALPPLLRPSGPYPAWPGAETDPTELLQAVEQLLLGSAGVVGPSMVLGARVWALTYGGRTVSLPDSKGLQDLAVLLERPGQEIPATELATPGAPVSERDGGAVIDPQARRALQQQLTALQVRLDGAEARGNTRVAATIRSEQQAIEAYLERATGKGGRARQFATADERARKAVGNRIRDALKRISVVHPELGEHLEPAVRLGFVCSYEPAEPTRWAIHRQRRP